MTDNITDGELEKQEGLVSNGTTGSNEKGASPRPIHGWKVRTMTPRTRDTLADQIQWAIAYTSMISTTFLFALDNTIVRVPRTIQTKR
jgi:hypothetical protein